MKKIDLKEATKGLTEAEIKKVVNQVTNIFFVKR